MATHVTAPSSPRHASTRHSAPPCGGPASPWPLRSWSACSRPPRQSCLAPYYVPSWHQVFFALCHPTFALALSFRRPWAVPAFQTPRPALPPHLGQNRGGILPIIRPGTPAAILKGATFLITTALAPMTECWPIRTGLSIFAPAPIVTSCFKKGDPSGTFEPIHSEPRAPSVTPW